MSPITAPPSLPALIYLVITEGTNRLEISGSFEVFERFVASLNGRTLSRWLHPGDGEQAAHTSAQHGENV